jgi:hypothetical protein
MKVHAKNTDRLGHLLNTLKVAGPQIPSLCSHFCSQSTTTLIERLVVFLSYMLVFPFPLSRSAPCPLPTLTRDRVPIPAATRDFGAPLLAPMLLLVTASHPSHPFPSDNTPFPSPSPSINHHRASHCWIRGDDAVSLCLEGIHHRRHPPCIAHPPPLGILRRWRDGDTPRFEETRVWRWREEKKGNVGLICPYLFGWIWES